MSVEDESLRERAEAVIPGGMYGHQSARLLPPNAPQFFERAEGAYLWDYDGRQFLDLMCGYGPNLFGYAHPAIDAAYIRQLETIDAATGPSAVMVELAEAYAEQVGHCDWTIFCKNGTDATSIALMTARAHAGRRKVLLAKGAYHGAAPWCTPMPAGTVSEDRAHFIHYVYNDVDSLRQAAADAGNDLAGIFASPFKHDVIVPQEAPDPAYAAAVRQICDETDALLIVDDVRAGFRISRDCSWSLLGIQPDLSSWGKAIANGHPISCLMGSDRARAAAQKLYVTGSYWFAAAAMAAGLETLELIRSTDYLERIETLGDRLREGLDGIAGRHGVRISQTGPVQMPLIMFDTPDGQRDMTYGAAFCDAMLAAGVYFHPFHNMFLNAAMTDDDIDMALDAADHVMADLPRGVDA